MQIDFLLFDEITALDAIGPYEVLAQSARRAGALRRPSAAAA